jgi:hypothetical protein
VEINILPEMDIHSYYGILTYPHSYECRILPKIPHI